MNEFHVALVASDLPPAPDWVTERLAQHSIQLHARLCSRSDQVETAADNADVIWVAGGSRVVTADLLPKLPRCVAILRTGSGTDNVPVEAASQLGIMVGNTPEAMMHAVAEHTLGLLFDVARQIALQDRLIRQGVWDARRAYPRSSFRGRTLGLVGFGRIARLVAKKASGLELNILACDPLLGEDATADFGVASASLHTLLEQSDFVSLHLPLVEGTRHLIGEAELRRMKPTAILVNTSRGQVIDEAALARALRAGWIAAAGLDVLETEPMTAENPLRQLENVVLTPHIGSYSDVYVENCWHDSVQTLIRIAQGHAPLWCVNLAAVAACKPPGRWAQRGATTNGKSLHVA
ncbi:MAG TPA: C-terminal binding protein [Pirellulales bacterium]|jgi:D-3-phosphoglycerate dehydrogenase|nr:C-terminal binding protein [Pirellulales bacterium]